MKILMNEGEYRLYATYLEYDINPLAALLQMTCIMEPELIIVPNETVESEAPEEPAEPKENEVMIDG